MSQDLMDLMKTRRSIREFKLDPIPREIIIELVQAASWAPSGSNQQPWRFIAVTSKAVTEEMAKAVDNKLKSLSSSIKSAKAREELDAYTKYLTLFAQAPITICVFSSDYRSLLTRLLLQYGVNAEVFHSSGHIQSCAAAVENMLLMAHSLGLGGCWMTGPLIAGKEISKLVQAEPDWKLICLVALGYPKAVPEPSPRPVPDSLVKFIG